MSDKEHDVRNGEKLVSDKPGGAATGNGSDVARPNPKGAPSAARGASSWVADLEAYSPITPVHRGHVVSMHVTIGVSPKYLTCRIHPDPFPPHP